MKLRPARSLFILLAFACFASRVTLGGAQEPEAEAPTPEIGNVQELMDDLAGRATGATSWSAEIDQIINMDGMVISSEGVIASRGKMSIAHFTMNVMGQEMTMAMVTDAAGITWMEISGAGQNMVMKMDMNQIQQSGGAGGSMGSMNPMGDSMNGQDPTKLLETLSQMGDLTYKGEGTVGEDATPVHLVVGQMDAEMAKLMDPQGQLANMGAEMTTFEVAIGAEDGFPRRVEFGSSTGERVMLMEYKNVEINPEIPDEAFTYEPPQGVMVMDLTAMMGSNFDATDIGTADMGNLSDAEKESLAEMGFTETAPRESNYNLNLAVGEKAPDFTAAALGGVSLSLSDFKGSPLLLDFWSSDSEPSVKALSEIVNASEKYGPLGLRVLGVSLDASRANLSNFLATHGRNDWPQIFDGKNWNGDMIRDYGVEAIPYRVLIDGDGVIRGVRLRGEALEEAVRELVVESPQ